MVELPIGTIYQFWENMRGNVNGIVANDVPTIVPDISVEQMASFFGAHRESVPRPGCPTRNATRRSGSASRSYPSR